MNYFHNFVCENMTDCTNNHFSSEIFGNEQCFSKNLDLLYFGCYDFQIFEYGVFPFIKSILLYRLFESYQKANMIFYKIRSSQIYWGSICK